MTETPDSQKTGFEATTEKVRDVIAGWIDTVTTQGEKAIDSLGLRSGRPWTPQVDVIEEPNQVVVMVDLPGVDPAQVETVLVGNMLTIKGEQLQQFTPFGRTTHRHERPHGSFNRSIPLPAPVNPEQVSADLKLGVLTITLTKEPPANPRPIPIKTGES